MIFKVYPRAIDLTIDDEAVQAIESSMSGETMIVHAPGLQFPALNGAAFCTTETFGRDFVEMSAARWIRASAIRSFSRFGDDYVRVMLADVRQAFDLFPGDEPLERVYKGFAAKLPRGRAPAFRALDVCA